MTAERLAPERIPALDGVRALAVALVMGYHFGGPLPGMLGVNIFFVLSGLLITTLLLDEHAASGDLNLRRFYLRRSLRIFPAYYVLLAVSSVALAAHRDLPVPGRAIALATYTLNYYSAVHGQVSAILGHTWSLAVEEQFYLLWPAVLLIVLRWGESRAAVAMLGFLATALLWRCWLVQRGVQDAWLYQAFDSRADMLVTGGLLAVLLRRPGWTSIQAHIARGPWMPLIPIALLWASQQLPVRAWSYRVGFTVDALLIALILAQLIPLSRRPGWRWLNHPWLARVGIWSYSLYLYHQWGWVFGDAVGASGLSKAAWSIVGTAVLAIASYRYVERPALELRRRLDRRWWPRPRSSGVAEVVASPEPA